MLCCQAADAHWQVCQSSHWHVHSDALISWKYLMSKGNSFDVPAHCLNAFPGPPADCSCAAGSSAKGASGAAFNPFGLPSPSFASPVPVSADNRFADVSPMADAPPPSIPAPMRVRSCTFSPVREFFASEVTSQETIPLHQRMPCPALRGTCCTKAQDTKCAGRLTELAERDCCLCRHRRHRHQVAAPARPSAHGERVNPALRQI